MCDENIFGSSLAVFGNLQEMFGNVQKMFRSVHLALETILENLRKSVESGRKSSENRQKRCHLYVYIMNRILHAPLWIQILSSLVQLNISSVRR